METTQNPTTSQTMPTVFDEKSYVMWMHIAQFAGFIFPFGSIVVPLIMWVAKKQESKTVDEAGKHILNFQISLMILVVISFVLIIFLVGILMLIGIQIFEVIVIIIAAIKARDGLPYRYPLTIEFIK